MGICANEKLETTRAGHHRGVLTVATLNYCGIMNSPYEFYCEDYISQLTDIGQEFVRVLPTYFTNFSKEKFDWNMGKIDVKYRTRYSPMFQLDVGIQDNAFMSIEQFKNKWDEVFKVGVLSFQLKYSQQERIATRNYDLAMYHALLKYVYKINEIADAKKLPVDKYIQTLKPLFELSFLDEQKKLKKLNQNFQRINADIFFFQQFSPKFYDELKRSGKYHIAQDNTKDTLVIARKSSFGQNSLENAQLFMSRLGDQFSQSLNWADRSSFLVIDKLFLICAHLSSKPEKNEPQLQQLQQSLLKLNKALEGQGYDIIVGGDLNAFLGLGQPFSATFEMYPTKTQEVTTIKKRTCTQGQWKKANKIVSDSKDKIISTLPITQRNISYISGKSTNINNLVPTNEHPFDHFVVIAKLNRKKTGKQ